MSTTHDERRENLRVPGSDYHSVEFYPQNNACAYQFKLWNVSSHGMCFLVKEGSLVLESLHVGDILKMKFYRSDDTEAPKSFEAEIKHITWNEEGRFRDHYLIGLSILNNDKS